MTELSEGRAEQASLAQSLLSFAGDRRFATILADPPWRFSNRTGKMAPEHRRLSRYETLTLDGIAALAGRADWRRPPHTSTCGSPTLCCRTGCT